MQKAIGRDTRHYSVLQVSDHFFQQKIIRMTLINTTTKIQQVIFSRLFVFSRKSSFENHLPCLTNAISTIKICSFILVTPYGNTVVEFQTGHIKLERFLPENQHTQRNFENFGNWTNREPQ